MSIGVFMLVKNEGVWVAPYLTRILPFIDEVVLFDGNSTDGTLDIIKAIRADDTNGDKIKLFEDKDVKDLRDDYTRVFNECMHSLSTDLAWFLHPDMHIVNPQQILLIKDSLAVALSTFMRSFAGNPDGVLYEIAGRSQTWKNIHRLRNPDLGAHYHGWYGAWNEDVYFSKITGDDHTLYPNMADYPYEVIQSGIEVLHFSDVRDHARRLGRMKTCLLNQGYDPKTVDDLAATHPRVTLKDGEGFSFLPAEYPPEFLAAREQYAHLMKVEETACA